MVHGSCVSRLDESWIHFCAGNENYLFVWFFFGLSGNLIEMLLRPCVSVLTQMNFHPHQHCKSPSQKCILLWPNECLHQWISTTPQFLCECKERKKELLAKTATREPHFSICLADILTAIVNKTSDTWHHVRHQTSLRTSVHSICGGICIGVCLCS